MPRVHYVKKAQKDNEVVKKGQPYYWWEFRHGGVHKSAKPPRQSQLTQSKMSGAYAAGEALSDAVAAATDPQDIVSALEDAAASVREVAEEYRESVSNMPESLQESPVAEECNNKADELDAWADDIESAQGEVEALDPETYSESTPPADEFDALTAEEQSAMLDDARAAADAVADCPL